jgi:hypothetical protein
MLGLATCTCQNNDLGKKLVEEEHLLQFLHAYQIITGIALSISSRGESPDFVCTRPSGELVGVELARSPHDYETRVDDRIWADRTLSSFDLLASVASIVATKEEKRQSNHWQDTILVVELLDYSFDSLAWASDTLLADDFSDTGFLEIWLADHSTVEPFGEVRLVGLYPSRIFGIHRQPALEGKPYG